jgi:hydrogenase maturation protein HypF
MLDNQIEAPCLAIVWDGSGLGDDGSLWGGEFLLITPHGFERRAHFLPFALPGGEQALREPRRAALGVLHALALPATRLGFDAASERWLLRALKQGINAPLTSSVGRLFDAVASLCGLCQLNSFEGEAAMALEFVAGEEAPGYDFVLSGAQLDWRPTLRQLIADLDAACAPSILSARFHQTLTDMALAVALSLGVQQVLLSGGCFQNTRLLESTLNALRAAGFAAFHHQRIPANDGGLAAGQIMAALRAAPLGENNGCA